MENIISKTYKFKIYPTESQKQQLENWFGCCRFIYNYFLSERQIYYKNTGKSKSFYDQCGDLTALKDEEGYEWLYQTPGQSQQAVLRNLDSAYSKFFYKKASFPKFHKKSSFQAITFTQANTFKLTNKLKLPKIKEWFKIKQHREMNGTIKRLVISKYPSGKYYANFIVEEALKSNQKQNNEIGIDLGIENYVITSDNKVFSNPRFINKYKKQLKIAQQHLSRKIKGSKSFESQKIKVAKIQEKIANCRTDMQYKLSYYLTTNYSCIYVEDLDIKGMKANHVLSKEIQDAAWNQFVNMLEYKGKWYNCTIKKINRWYPSSKTCSNCGYIKEDLALRDRVWVCPKCGKKHNRDLNAAINILNEGQIENKSSGTGDYTDGEKIRLSKLKNLKSKSLRSQKTTAFKL